MSEAAPEPKENMGRPEPRIDGRLKVTGAALYGADHKIANPLYGVLITSEISKGKITAIDVKRAENIPGVAAVYTHVNMPPIGKFAFFGAGGESSSKHPALSGPEIYYYGQIIGLAVAETFEIASEAAFAVRVSYEAQKPSPSITANAHS